MLMRLTTQRGILSQTTLRVLTMRILMMEIGLNLVIQRILPSRILIGTTQTKTLLKYLPIMKIPSKLLSYQTTLVKSRTKGTLKTETTSRNQMVRTGTKMFGLTLKTKMKVLGKIRSLEIGKML